MRCGGASRREPHPRSLSPLAGRDAFVASVAAGVCLEPALALLPSPVSGLAHCVRRVVVARPSLWRVGSIRGAGGGAEEARAEPEKVRLCRSFSACPYPGAGPKGRFLDRDHFDVAAMCGLPLPASVGRGTEGEGRSGRSKTDFLSPKKRACSSGTCDSFLEMRPTSCIRSGQLQASPSMPASSRCNCNVPATSSPDGWAGV
jgi:hypothetical protein